MKIERDYLTVSEIRYVADLVTKIESTDFATREYVKVLTVADMCTDIKLSKGTDENGEETLTWKEEVYDEMWKNGDVEVLYDKIRNIYLIDETIEKNESIYNLVKSKIEDISKSISEVKVEDLISNFAKELTNVKELAEEKK